MRQKIRKVWNGQNSDVHYYYVHSLPLATFPRSDWWPGNRKWLKWGKVSGQISLFLHECSSAVICQAAAIVPPLLLPLCHPFITPPSSSSSSSSSSCFHTWPPTWVRGGGWTTAICAPWSHPREPLCHARPVKHFSQHFSGTFLPRAGSGAQFGNQFLGLWRSRGPGWAD